MSIKLIESKKMKDRRLCTIWPIVERTRERADEQALEVFQKLTILMLSFRLPFNQEESFMIWRMGNIASLHIF